MDSKAVENLKFVNISDGMKLIN